MTSSLEKLGRRGIFQCANGAGSVAKKKVLKIQVKTLTWPSMSPHLNPMKRGVF